MDRKIPSKLDRFEPQLLAMRYEENLSFRDMAAAMQARHHMRVSYRTIQNFFTTRHPELADDQDTETSDENNTPAPRQRTEGGKEKAAASMPTEDMTALQAQLDALTRAQRTLQQKNTALEADLAALTEPRHGAESPPPGSSLLAPVYRGSWERGLYGPLDDAIDLPQARPPRPVRSVLVLGAGCGLALLALYLLVFHTPDSPSWQISSYSALYASLRVSLTRSYVTFMRSPHAPFLLLEAALTLSGLALGLRGKTLALVLLAWIGYLILLKGSMFPFVLVLLLTLKVSQILIRGR